VGAPFHSNGGLIPAPSPVNSLGILPPSVITELFKIKSDFILGVSAMRTEEKITNQSKFKNEQFTLLKPLENKKVADLENFSRAEKTLNLSRGSFWAVRGVTDIAHHLGSKISANGALRSDF